MYIERVPNRNSPPAILLRESYREGKKVRKRTVANLTKWSQQLVEGLRILLKGGAAVDAANGFQVIRSLPHGHVAAVLGTLRNIGLDRVLGTPKCPEREQVIALICARILFPGSKLATARGLAEQTQFNSLGEQLDLKEVDEDTLYAALDWLRARQGAIEAQLAARHLHNGALVLYDLTSTYFEGRACPLAQRGYSRDGKKGTLQIVFGLLCDRRGCPVGVEVFEGNTADPKSVTGQIEKLRQRFGLTRVVLVGDRGLLTEARIREAVQPVDGLDWITALRAPAIRTLVEQKAVQLSLFDQRDLATFYSPDYPGERLIVCKNPLLAKDRARKREDLLQATEQLLDKIVQATQRPTRKLNGQAKIGVRVGKVFNRFKVAKHFELDIQDESFHYRRNQPKIEQEAALDGLYIIRTSVPETVLDEHETVHAYKDLAHVERAFRSLKTVDLKVRPIYHYKAERVRAHIFLCMLAYYLEWHMRQFLAPILFEDDDKTAAKTRRASPVKPARVSNTAQRKAQHKQTADGLPVHSFQSLLADLATLAKNRIQIQLPTVNNDEVKTFDRITQPTPLQQKAFDLLGVRL